MFFSRICRQGAHHVNSRSLSGSKRRERSTRPRSRMRASIACSSGVWPVSVGLRSLGWTSRGSRATLRSPQTRSCRPAASDLGHERVEGVEEAHLGRIVPVAVGDVHGREDPVADLRGDDARLHVEGRMDVGGRTRERVLPEVEGDARVPLVAVPVAPVALEVAHERGHRFRRGLDLLQAQDVGLLASHPLEHGLGAGADAVDVPRRDLHASISGGNSLPFAVGVSPRSPGRLYLF